MPTAVTVTMHAGSVWPTTIEPTVFICYLEGYSVEETVEHLMSLTSAAADGNATEAVSTSRSGAAETALTPSVLQCEEQRCEMLDDEMCCEECATDSFFMGVKDDAVPTEPTTTEPEPTQQGGANGGIIINNNSKQHDTHRRGSKGSHHTHARSSAGKQPHRHQWMPAVMEGAGGSKSSKQQRKRKEKDHATQSMRRQMQQYMQQGRRSSSSTSQDRHPVAQGRSFFLNEDYLNFQKKLQVEEGGPESGAPLKSRLLFQEITEQYHLFDMLSKEDYLGAPYALLSRHYIPISISDRKKLVGLYYEVDPDVFRYYFGSRFKQFEPIDLHSGKHPQNIFRWRLSRNSSTSSSNSNNNNAGNSDTANTNLTLPKLLGINHKSLKHQWGSIKKVCTTITTMYSGRGDMIIPRGVSLLAAVQRCYGLRDALAMHYATAVFGFYHRFTGRILDRMAAFEDYSTLCNVIASQWCDDSLLIMDADFLHGCRRIARLLDETRVLAEIHQQVFGEAMRARWQVQLDEVQRAITSEKTTATSAAAVLNMMSPIYAGTSSIFTGGPDSGGAAPHSETLRKAQDSTTSNASGTTPMTTNVTTNVPPLANNSNNTSRADVSFSPSSAVYQQSTADRANNNSNNNNNSSGAAASPTSSAPLSANQRFSRRFMLEFPHLMRYFRLMATQLAASETISDAMETFYTRVYTNLESMSARSAPAVASMVSAAASRANAHRSSSAPSSPPPPPVPGGAAKGTASPSAAPVTLRSSSEHTLDMSSSAVRHAGAGMNKSTSFSHVSAHAAAAPAGEVPSSPLLQLRDEHYAMNASFDSMAVHPVTSIVNSSMAHPATSLLPMTALAVAAAAAMADGGAQSPMKRTTSFSTAMEVPQSVGMGGDTTESGETYDTVGRSAAFVDGVQHGDVPLPFSPTTVGSLVMRAMDKRYLRELCQLLTALPAVWRQLSCLSAEDHEECDKHFSNYFITLKAVSQVLMAAEDFQ